MSSTGWIVATGAVTFANQIATDPKKEINWVTVPVATGGAVVAGKLMERVSTELATMIAIIAFVTVVFAPLNGVKSPAQSLLTVMKRFGVTE